MKQHAGYLFLLFIFILMPKSVSASLKYNEGNFLIVSDIHLDHATSHTMEISPSKGNLENDLDLPTFEKLISEVDKNITIGIVAQPDFIIILGDIPGHARSSSDGVLQNESIVFSELKKNFPTTPILYTFGNNDSLKINYGPFKDSNSRDKCKSPYDIAKIYGGWQDGFLSTGTICDNVSNKYPCIITEDTTNGYYSAYLKSKLRFIAINSALFSPKRTQVNAQDALNELQWLENQLKSAKSNQDFVLLAMHISPGNDVLNNASFWLPEEQAIFLKMLTAYHQNIIGLLASHTHSEELKVIKDSSRKNLTGVYLNAALSTSHGNEPSIKTFYLSQQSGQWLLANYETFHFSQEKSHLLFNKLYDYKKYYCDVDQDNGLFQCLDNITAVKMKKYLSAGNKNHAGIMGSPEAIYLVAQE